MSRRGRGRAAVLDYSRHGALPAPGAARPAPAHQGWNRKHAGTTRCLCGRIVSDVKDRATIKDVAKGAGVSIATVSRALNDKGDVSDGTRERVLEVARSVGYNVDRAARSLVTQKTRLVAVVVGDNAGHRDLSLVFFGKVLAAISRRLAQSGYEPLLLQPQDTGPEHRFDAAVLIGVDDDDALVADLESRQVPLVGVDVRCAGSRAVFVGSDHADGVRLALAHLHALGHRRIAHIAGAMNTVAGSERLHAFRLEVQALGLERSDELLRHGDFSSASGYREMCALLALSERPTALVAASDLMALAAMQAIRDAGLQPGPEVAVVGFDDLEAAALAYPPLTTIRQDRQELGTLAATRAIELIDDAEAVPPATVLPVELVVRGSST
jgi:LacI family transcriptional regulator